MGLFVSKGDIHAVSSSSLCRLLKKDADDCDSIKRAVTHFINYSSHELSGPAYDAARNEMQQYLPILDQRKRKANNLAAAIKSGCSNLSSYMGRFSELDESLREQYVTELNSLKATLASLGSSNKKTNMFDYWRTYFNCKRIIEEHEEYLAKLDGLPGADAGAYGMISGVE